MTEAVLTALEAGDTLVLVGSHTEIDRAFRLLGSGSSEEAAELGADD